MAEQSDSYNYLLPLSTVAQLVQGRELGCWEDTQSFPECHRDFLVYSFTVFELKTFLI